MEKQSEAERLAAYIEGCSSDIVEGLQRQEIADELRRLHAENKRLKSRIAMKSWRGLTLSLGWISR